MNMTLAGMKSQLEHLRQTAPIGQTIRKGELICRLSGLTLDEEGTLRLLALEIDPEYWDWLEERKNAFDPPPLTRRQAMLRQENPPFRRVVGFPQEIFFGQLGLKIAQWSSEYGAENQAALFCRLLSQGWDPGELGQWGLDRLLFSCWTFEGKFEKIPEIDCQELVRFWMRETTEVHPVELPLSLTVEQGTEKILFTDKTDGKTRWMQILSLRLEDMWRQMEEVFDEHRRRGELPAEQIDQMQAQFTQDFAKVCPRGMLYPVIEYQCEDDSQLDFDLSQSLDQPQDSSGHSFGFLVRPEQGHSLEGRKIRAAVIQQPVAPDAKKIQAELFSRLAQREATCVQFGKE